MSLATPMEFLTILLSPTLRDHLGGPIILPLEGCENCKKGTEIGKKKRKDVHLKMSLNIIFGR